MPRNALLTFRPEVFSRALAVTARQLDLPLNDLLNRLGLPRNVRRHANDALRIFGRLDWPRSFAACGPLRLRSGGTGCSPATRSSSRATHSRSRTALPAVLRALHLLDGSVDAECTDWLLARLDEKRPLPMGLYVGRAGIGLALLELGLDDRGLLAGATTEALTGDKRGGLATGMAGVGVAQLYAHRLTGSRSTSTTLGRSRTG